MSFCFACQLSDRGHVIFSRGLSSSRWRIGNGYLRSRLLLGILAKVFFCIPLEGSRTSPFSSIVPHLEFFGRNCSDKKAHATQKYSERKLKFSSQLYNYGENVYLSIFFPPPSRLDPMVRKWNLQLFFRSRPSPSGGNRRSSKWITVLGRAVFPPQRALLEILRKCSLLLEVERSRRSVLIVPILGLNESLTKRNLRLVGSTTSGAGTRRALESARSRNEIS